jgi:hypothetical protein
LPHPKRRGIAVTDLDQTLLHRHVASLLAPWRDAPGPGVTIGVVRGRELVLHESAGLASIELGVPIGADTTFRIGQQAVHLRGDPAAGAGGQALAGGRCPPACA